MNGRARLARAALVLVVLAPAAACRQSADTEQPAPKRESDAGKAEADYAACRARAEGPRELVACGSAAIDAAAPGLDDSAFAALAEAAESRMEDSLTNQVVLADALARLALERAQVRLGRPLADAGVAPVPAELAEAGAPIVAGTCSGSQAVDACRAAHGQLLPRFAARVAGLSTSESEDAPFSASLGAYQPPTCAAVRAAPSADAALGDFESTFPAALKDERLVETVALDDQDVRRVSAYLACLSARTAFAPDVVETSLNLFASKRNGARAREALATLAQGRGEDADAAREFAAQVTDYLAGPEG